MNNDPWAHRAKGMRCSTCMWFAEKPGGELGRCRRHAPTMSGYPAVYPSDWCGDHKLDETKLPPPPVVTNEAVPGADERFPAYRT